MLNTCPYFPIAMLCTPEAITPVRLCEDTGAELLSTLVAEHTGSREAGGRLLTSSRTRDALMDVATLFRAPLEPISHAGGALQMELDFHPRMVLAD